MVADHTPDERTHDPSPLANRSESQPRDSPPHRDREAGPTLTAVRDLIEAGGPSIVYQPIVHIETGKVIGAEALSRFPAGSSTGQWFETAALLGVGADLEMSAAHNALKILDAAGRERLGWELVGINISPHTLRDPRFDQLLSDHIGPQVVLELTHHDELPDWPTLRGYLNRARQLGAWIAVNAVSGDPAAQFQRLIEIAPDIVKLHTSYTSTLIDNHARRGVADEFLLSCTRHGVFVIGVGVEQPTDLAVLREVGVEGAQGYLLGKPVPLADFERRDNRWSNASIGT